jgi:hypothetical protein
VARDLHPPFGGVEIVPEQVGHQMDERTVGALERPLGFNELAAGTDVGGRSRRQIEPNGLCPFLYRLR